MRRIMQSTLVAALALVVVTSGCNILEEKVVEVVLFSETFADFSQNSASQNFQEENVIDFQTEIEDALSDNGYDRPDTVEASIVGASVGATAFQHDHDWTISGRIDVEYVRIGPGNTETSVAGPTMLIDYQSQSVQEALGEKIPVDLEDAGLAVLQQALDDFLEYWKGDDTVLGGDRIVLKFTIVNGSVTPPPSTSDRIVFDWRAWLAIHVIVEESVEVPDPF